MENNKEVEILKSLERVVGGDSTGNKEATPFSKTTRKTEKNKPKTVTFSSQSYHEKIGLIQKYISEVLLNGYTKMKKGEALDYLINREYDIALEYYKEKGEIDE